MQHRSTLYYTVGQFFVTCLLVFFVISCDKEESFPIEPHIEFVDVKFIDVDDPNYYMLDTLKLTFEYTDGDGDLGYKNELDLPPYRFYFKLNDPTKYTSYSTNNSLDRYVNYKAKRTNSNYDTLPSFTCSNWEIVYKTTNYITEVYDTLYSQYNLDLYNLNVRFMVEQADGSFAEFDFHEQFCSLGYNGVFFTESAGPITIKRYSPKHGQLTYNMIGSGFKQVFATKKMKLLFYVKDRALHKSNIIETPLFTFQ